MLGEVRVVVEWVVEEGRNTSMGMEMVGMGEMMR